MATYNVNNFINDPSTSDRLMFIYNSSQQLVMTIDPYSSTYMKKSKYVYIITDGKMNYENVLDFSSDTEADSAVARLNDVKKSFIEDANSMLDNCGGVVSQVDFIEHTGNTDLHITPVERLSLNESNNPSSSNPFATLDDISIASGDTKRVKISGGDDTAGFLSEKITGSSFIELNVLDNNSTETLEVSLIDLVLNDLTGVTISNPIQEEIIVYSANTWVNVKVDDIVSNYTLLSTFYNHTGNTQHLISDWYDALSLSPNPATSVNPIATIADIQASATGLTIATGDARYIRKTGDTMIGDLLMAANIIPTTDGLRSLGSTTNQWKDLWVSSGTIYLDRIPLSTDGTNLLFSGSTIVGRAGGLHSDIQINSGDTLVGVSSFTYNFETNILSVKSLSATTLYGDGSNLTNLITTLSALTDTKIDNPEDGQILQFSSNDWYNVDPVDMSLYYDIDESNDNFLSANTNVVGLGGYSATTINVMIDSVMSSLTSHTSLTGSSNPHLLSFDDLIVTPTTLSGYGVTDSYTITEIDDNFLSADTSYYTQDEVYNTGETYTQTEIDDLLIINDDKLTSHTSLTGSSNPHSLSFNDLVNSSHTHDNRYYTETEIDDNFLSGDTFIPTDFYSQQEVDDNFLSGNTNVVDLDGIETITFNTYTGVTAPGLYVDLVNKQFISGEKTFTSTVTINGDLFVSGKTTTIDSENVTIKDNIILINSGETSSGVTLGIAGIEIDRGYLENYIFVYDEEQDNFRIGESGSTQAVASREDAPVVNGVAYWNNTLSRLDTNSNLTFLNDTLIITNSNINNLSATTIYGNLIGSVDWNDVKNTPTTLNGYGITDVYNTAQTYTQTEIEQFITDVSDNIDDLSDDFNSHSSNTDNPHQTTFEGLISTAHTHIWYDIVSTPTTISGYGITDVYVKTETYTQTEIDNSLSLYTELVDFQEHSVDATIHFTKSSIELVDLSNTSHTHIMVDVVGLQSVLDSKTDLSVFNVHTALTNAHDVSFDNLISTAHTHLWIDISNTSHTHDNRYYTESEIDELLIVSASTSLEKLTDTIISSPQQDEIMIYSAGTWVNAFNNNNLSNYYDKGEIDFIITDVTDELYIHTGDTSIHFTKNEILFSELGNTSHTHIIGDVDNLQTNLNNKTNLITFYSHTADTSNPHQTTFSDLINTAHTHDDRYYTKSENDVLLFNVSNDLTAHTSLIGVENPHQISFNDLVNTSHTHDDRYYTENEVDNYFLSADTSFYTKEEINLYFLSSNTFDTIIETNGISNDGNVSATTYFGDGSNLTNLITTLSALTDTTIDLPLENQVLVYSGGSWINMSPSNIEDDIFDELNVSVLNVTALTSDSITATTIYADIVGNVDWVSIDNTPTTLSGYSIIDSYTITETIDNFLSSNTFIPTDFYSQQEVEDNFLSANTFIPTDFYSQQEVDDNFLSGDTFIPTDFYSQQEVDDNFLSGNTTLNDLSGVSINSVSNGQYLSYLNGVWIPVNDSTDLSNYYDKEQIDDNFLSANTFIPTDFYTQQQVEDNFLSGNTTLDGLSGVSVGSVTNGQFLSYLDGEWISVNDSTDLSNYYNKTEVDDNFLSGNTFDTSVNFNINTSGNVSATTFYGYIDYSYIQNHPLNTLLVDFETHTATTNAHGVSFDNLVTTSHTHTYNDIENRFVYNELSSSTYVLDSFDTTMTDACHWQYVIRDGVNVETGTIMGVWDLDSSVVTHTQYSTEELGETDVVSFDVGIDNNIVRLLTTIVSGTWNIKIRRLDI